jgi:hypothetical protein
MLLVQRTHKRPWTRERFQSRKHSCTGLETNRRSQTRLLLHRRLALTVQGKADIANKETPHVAIRKGMLSQRELLRCSIGARTGQIQVRQPETSNRVVAQHERRQKSITGQIPKGLLTNSPFEALSILNKMYSWNAPRTRPFAGRKRESGATALEATRCETC